MKALLHDYRDTLLDTLLRFLWRAWTSVGISGHTDASFTHVVDPEALLLFTASLGRYDQRLFDEVLEWLQVNGRFINIHRLKNIMRKEPFSGKAVLAAIANHCTSHDTSQKWKLLGEVDTNSKKHFHLFFLSDGRPLPVTGDKDPHFLKHGFIRNTVQLRSHGLPFSTDTPACRWLQLRAIFGVGARSDIITYLLLNERSYSRELAQELYYSQKAIHEVMRELELSTMLYSVKQKRERIFRLSADWNAFLGRGTEKQSWINWPILLQSTEAFWYTIEELCTSTKNALAISSDIALQIKQIQERLVQDFGFHEPKKAGEDNSFALLENFRQYFEHIVQ